MNTLPVIYHMARADFLERVRRYSFLIMLGLVVWLGYVVNTGGLVLSVPPEYVGEINSPWVGALMTVTVGMFLGWFGFYLVKGSVARDYETGVGQILAATPLSRPVYVLGKWLSNFAVLAVMVLIMAGAGVVMVLLAARAPLEGWSLVSPLLIIALPLMAVVAAVAVLFEAIGWLRGTFGNIVYWFLFLMLLIPAIAVSTYQPLLDFLGLRLIGEGIRQAAVAAYPDAGVGFSYQIAQTLTSARQFHYAGIAWTPDLLAVRFGFVLIAVALVLLASLFFDRFNTSKAPRGRRPDLADAGAQALVASAAPLPQPRLTALVATRRFRFGAVYAAELKLLLKGRRWWWYAIAVGLTIAQLLVPLDSTAAILAITWFWMIALLSGLGAREAQQDTREIVFSAPHPVATQLPALWLAAVTVMALAGSGAFIHYLVSGDPLQLLPWLGGVLFVPSLAVGLGTLTQSPKAFEVIYVTWMYLVLQKIPPVDFVGVTRAGPWQLYLALAVILFCAALLGRAWQTKKH